jgi:hypothetical protein
MVSRSTRLRWVYALMGTFEAFSSTSHDSDPARPLGSRRIVAGTRAGIVLSHHRSVIREGCLCNTESRWETR